MKTNGHFVGRRCDALNLRAPERAHLIKKVCIQLAAQTLLTIRRVNADEMNVSRIQMRLRSKPNQEGNDDLIIDNN